MYGDQWRGGAVSGMTRAEVVTAAADGAYIGAAPPSATGAKDDVVNFCGWLKQLWLGGQARSS